MRRFFLAASLVALSASASTHAQESSPEVLLRQLTEEVTAEIRRDKSIRSGDAKKIAALVDAKIVPHFDLPRITQTAVGAGWRGATPEQREKLTQEFKTLLVRTYSGALAGYRDQVIEYQPLRLRADATEVTVRSRIRQSGAEPISVDYDLAKVGTQWKVFDLRISGISLVATYRTSFAEEVRNNGVDGLITLLERKNRQG